jgi:DNA-binding transcriptional LysR family regulator
MDRIIETGLPPLDWLRAFEAAARRGSFTAAAAELGLTQPAVSQQIRKLESRLGAALFYRLPRRVELTEAGAAYLPHVQASFAALARNTRQLFVGEMPAVSVSLRSPVSFATLWLAPRLPRLMARLPQLALSIATVHIPGDYERAESDLEVRFGDVTAPGREMIRLARESLTPVCAPALATHGDDAWARAPLITVIGAREMWAEWFTFAGTPPSGTSRLKVDTFIAAYEAARAGTGVLLGSRPLIDGALAAGSLVRLSDLELTTARGHVLVYRAGSTQRPLVGDVVDWLRRETDPNETAPGFGPGAA